MSLSEEEAAAARTSAADTTQIRVRLQLADFTSKVFSDAGDELYMLGHLFGPDRASGASPHGNGSDEIVAVSMLLRICSQLVSGAHDLFRSDRTYAAAALVRQMVEIEYLAWAFQTRDKDAERWLRSDAEARQKFFTPKKLRDAAKGKFRGKDYGYHCELGGHPVPGSEVLLRDSTFVAQLLLSDMLGHTGRIWDHLMAWSVGNEWAGPIHSRGKKMYQRYAAWKEVDKLIDLPPPP